MSINATIFIPKQLETKKSGPLHGKYTTASGPSSVDTENVVVVVLPTQDSQDEQLGFMATIRENEPAQRHHQKNYIFWLVLQNRLNDSINVKSLDFHGQRVPLGNITIVYYDSEEICESELIPQKYLAHKKINQQQAQLNYDVLSYFVECVVAEEERKTKVKENKNSLRIVVLLDILIYILTLIPNFCIKKVHQFLQSRIDYTSSALQQIIQRTNHLERLRKLMKSRESRRGGNLLVGRLVVMIFVDILFGITLAYFISHHASVSDMYATFCNWTMILSSFVQDLLEWLSGAPAGLKLNQPLTQALSAFFSYHVHLWRLYLELADPLLRALAWILVWLGMFGLSIQIAILSDLLDLATLHLYCFYVYAARIHMLQISLLGSQWRAFRGRKWNPLKLRIDSDTGNHMSLKRVLTAVVFTLVIFLLPTTTVYYLVFVMLRVSLSGVRSILDMFIWILNCNPIYLVILNASDSNQIKGDICLQVRSINKNQLSSTLKLQLCTWPTPVTEAVTYATCDELPSYPSFQWKSFLSSIMFGRDLL